jgi:site-specific DNA-cytosine methylase
MEPIGILICYLFTSSPTWGQTFFVMENVQSFRNKDDINVYGIPFLKNLNLNCIGCLSGNGRTLKVRTVIAG